MTTGRLKSVDHERMLRASKHEPGKWEQLLQVSLDGLRVQRSAFAFSVYCTDSALHFLLAAKHAVQDVLTDLDAFGFPREYAVRRRDPCEFFPIFQCICSRKSVAGRP